MDAVPHVAHAAESEETERQKDIGINVHIYAFSAMPVEINELLYLKPPTTTADSETVQYFEG